MNGRAVTRTGRFYVRLRRYFEGPVFSGGEFQLPRAGISAPSMPPAGEGIFARQARQFTISQALVWGFYAFVAYYVVTQCDDFIGLSRRTKFSTLWPVGWLPHVAESRQMAAIIALEAFYALTNLFGAFLAKWRAGRILVFLGLLEYIAFRNSFGKVGHSTHLLVTVAMLLVLLPSKWHESAALASRRTRSETLLVFWLCQAAILMSYSMSGLAKLGAALYQMAVGQMSAFSPGALGAHIAQRLVQTHTQSVLGDFIIAHPWLTWPLMPFPIYLELFAFWIAFRPGLQRWWALILILFHVGTVFTMTITFPVSCFLLALFFFQSPFVPSMVPSWRATVLSIPLVCELLRLPSFFRHLRGWRRRKKFPR